MKPKYTAIFFLLAAILTACNLTISPNSNPGTSTISTLPPASVLTATSIPSTAPPIVIIEPTAVTPLLPQQAVLNRALELISAIKNQDMLTLSDYVDPVNGLRFAPYAFVSDTYQVFSPVQVANMLADSKIYSWGVYSGSGAPIDLSFPEYYAQFIYDEDFIFAPKMSLNHRLGVSTSMDNIFEFYPGSMFVEFYFPGFDPQLEGMDWRSLRLVFTQFEGTWYLTAIIHDQWTT